MSNADEALTAERLSVRAGHRASAKLLDTQFATLEEPRDALRLVTSVPVSQLVQTVIDAWHLL